MNFVATTIQSGQSCLWQQCLHSLFLPLFSPRIIFVDYSYKIPQAHVKNHLFINSSLLPKAIFIYFRTSSKVWIQSPQMRHSVVQCCPLQILKGNYSSLLQLIFSTCEKQEAALLSLTGLSILSFHITSSSLPGIPLQLRLHLHQTITTGLSFFFFFKPISLNWFCCP